MEDQKKLSAKDFIKQKKLMMKNIKSMQVLQSQLNILIQNKDASSFIEQLMKQDNLTILNYIFCEDELKKTPIMKILENNQAEVLQMFLKPISQWSAKNSNWINENYFIKMQQNKLVLKDWQNRWFNFTKQVTSTILKQQGVSILIIKIFTIQKSIFLTLNKLFLEVEAIKNLFPKSKTTDQLQLMLTKFFIPISRQIDISLPDSNFKMTAKLQNYKSFILKQKIWKSKDYLSLIKNSQLNFDIFQLKELEFSFIHQLMLQKQLDKIIQIYEALQNSQNQNYQSYKSKIFNQCDQSEQIPSDICLRTWTYDQITKFLQLILQKQHINLSTNCLNLVLLNKNLSQKQKQGLLQSIINGAMFQKGFCKTIREQNHIFAKSGKYSKINGSVKTHLTHFFISFDKSEILGQKDRHNSYPLLNYLDLYRQKSDIRLVSLLFVDFLDRKYVKTKLVGMVKSFGTGKIQFKSKSQGQNIINNILYYYQPFINLICKIDAGQILQYLLTKTFINSHQIKIYKQQTKQQTKFYVNLIGRHFLSIYVDKSKYLGENKINILILDKIFNCKQSQKFIKSTYNFYYQLLRSMNQTSQFKYSKEWMICEIKKRLTHYFQKLQTQQLFLTQLSYIQNSKPELLINQLNPVYLNNPQKDFQKLKLNYNQQKDWSLLNMQKLTAIINTDIIKKYIKSQINQSLQSQSKITSKTENSQYMSQIRQNCTLKILHFKQGYLKPESEVEWFDLTIQSVKKAYAKQSKQKNLSTYIKKLKAQIQVEKTIPEGKAKLKKYIQLSIYETNLQQKVKLIISNNLDFAFLKRHIVDGQKLAKLNKLFEQSDIQDKGLKSICQRMILKECSFSTSIRHCQKDQIDQINFILQTQQGLQFINTLSKNNFKYSRFQYPFSFQEPENFYMSIKLAELISSINLQKGQLVIQQISKDNLVDEFISNLQYGVTIINKNSDRLNNKYDKNDQYFNKFIQLWRYGHEFIKNTMNYQEYIKYEPQQQFKCQTKQPQSSGRQQQIQSKQQQLPNSSRKPQPQFYYLIARYYENLRRIIFSYHSWKINLSRILIELQIQEIIDPNSNTLCLYKMQVSQNPYAVFKEWLHVQPSINNFKIRKTQFKILINQKAIFLQQLKRMNLNQFMEVIQIITLQKIQQALIMDMGYILHQIKDQQKIIKLLKHLLLNPKLSKKINDQYLINLIDERYPQLIIFILFFVHQKQFTFRIQQKSENNQTLILRCDNISFYSKCNLATFQIVKKYLLNYLAPKSQLITQENQKIHIQNILQSLVSSQNWARLKLLLQIQNMTNYLLQNTVHSAFRSLSSQIESIKNLNNPSQVDSIVKILFKLYKKYQLKADQDLFVSAFILHPQMAFDQMHIESLKLMNFVKCLKEHPKKANLFLVNKTALSPSEVIPETKQLKKIFPISSYYAYDFQNSDWMIDLLRVQKVILKAIGHQNLMDSKLQTLVLLDKMEQNFQQFYTSDQINMKCKKILSSNNIQSIKKYPQKWFQQYFQKHTNINLQIMRQNVVMQLVDWKIVDIAHTLKVISTCKLQVLKYFLKVNQLKFDVQLLKSIQKNNLKGKSFWQYLVSNDNQTFVLELINQFNMFQMYPVEEYQQILLKNICFFKRNLILQYIISYFQKKNQKKIVFVAGDLGSIKPGLIVLPMQEAVQCNYYQYYFLIKSSGNQTPDFYTSSRFLIKIQPQKLKFIPELSRRIQIINILTEILKNGGQMQFKMNTIIKTVLDLKIKKNKSQVQTLPIQDQVKIKKQKIKWLLSLENLIKYVVQPPKDFFQNKKKQDIGIFQKLLAIIFNRLQNNIPQQQLVALFPTEMKIINSIKKFIKDQQDSSLIVDSIFSQSQELINLLLIYSPFVFLEKYSHYLTSPIESIDCSIFIRGVQINLPLFEQKHVQTLQKYIKLCFFQNLEPYDSTKYSVFLKKGILLLCLLSSSQGNGKCVQIFQTLIPSLATKSNLQCLYQLSRGINQRSSHSIFQKTTYSNAFDMMVWNNLAKSINQIQNDRMAKNKQNFDKNCFVSWISQVSSILYDNLSQSYQIQIQKSNIEQILKNVISVTQETALTNIHLMLSLLMNCNYIFCETHNFALNIKKQFYKEEKSKQLRFAIILRHESQQTQSKFKTNFTQTQTELSLEFQIYYSISKAQSISLISIQFQKAIQKSKLQFALEKLSKDNKIQSLNKFCLQSNRLSIFRNLQFEFDFKSLCQIKDYKILQSLIEEIPMASNGINSMKTYIQDLQEKINNDRNFSYYGLSDVYGPIKITQDRLTIQKILNCLSFYQILQVPQKRVIVHYRSSHKNDENSQQIQDVQQYIKYFTNQITDSHSEVSYKFQNTIQLSENTQNKTVFCNTNNFSLANIARFLSIFNYYSSQISKTFQNQIDLRYNILSVFQICKDALKDQRQKQKSVFSLITYFLRDKSNKALTQNILFMIIEDAVNIMKVVRGILISYKYTKQTKVDVQQSSYYISQFVKVQQVQYQISDQILQINIYVYLQFEKKSVCSLEQSNLISRKGFLNSIFSSSEFLTDYFLQPSKINSECLNVSRHLTKKLNTTINVHVNYKSLYDFVDYLKNQPQLKIKEIDEYLNNIRTYLLGNMQKCIVNQLTSQQCCNRHQVLLLNTFQALNFGSLKHIQKIKCEQIWELNSIEDNNKGLQLIFGFGGTVTNFAEFGKNMFFIQIYKSHFSSIVSEGMMFLIGYKNTSIPPCIMNLKNKDDINKVNLIDIAYLLLVSSEILSNDELSHQKIIRIFVSDLNLNIYQVNDKVAKLMLRQSNQRQNQRQQISIKKNISQLIPIVSSNIVITFRNEFAKPQNVQGDRKDLKVFSINLQKIDQDKKQQKQNNKLIQKSSLMMSSQKSSLKLAPVVTQKISLINSLKRDNQLNLTLKNFLSVLKTNMPNSNIKFFIQPGSQEQGGVSHKKISDILQLILIDIQSSILSFGDQPLRHPTLQTVFSNFQKQSKQHKNIKQNVFVQLRKRNFTKFIKSYRIKLSSIQKTSKVSIQNGQILLEISLTSESKFIKQQDITCQLVQYLIKMSLQTIKKEQKLKVLQNQELDLNYRLSKNYLMKMLDIVNIWQIQQTQLQQAILLINSELQIITKKQEFQFSLGLTKEKKSGIQINFQDKIQIYFHYNTENVNRQFYTSPQILTFLWKAISINKTNNNVNSSSKQIYFQINEEDNGFKTLYNPKLKVIQIYNYLSLSEHIQNTQTKIQYILLTVNKQHAIQKYNLKTTIQSSLKASINVQNILQKINGVLKYIIIDKKNKNCTFNYLYQLPKPQNSLQVITKKSTSSFINKPQYIYCYLQHFSNSLPNDLDFNICPINIAVKYPLQKQSTYVSILRPIFNEAVTIRKISRQMCQIELNFKSACHVMVNLATYKNIYQNQVHIFSLVVSSNAQLCIQKIKFVEVSFRNKITQSKQQKFSDNNQTYQFFKQPPQKISMKSKIQISEGKQKSNSQKLDSQSLVYVVNNQSKKYLTRAGEYRIDYIYLCDNDGNPINYKQQFDVFFQHINHLCTIIPQVIRTQANLTKLGLKWKPVIRGHYKIYINNICLNPEYQIGVCAAEADPLSSMIQKPKIKKVCYAEQTECTFNLRDSYGNIYTQLEQSIVGDGIIIQIIADQMNSFIKKKQQPINKNGIKKIRFSVDNPVGLQQKKINITIAMNKEVICQFALEISGQALKQRKHNLEKDISAKNKGFYKQIIISRYKFMQDLFKIAQKSLFTNFSVKFVGEQGIDAGGLKRQFYDMIGAQLKNQQNPFFKPVDSKKLQYFINSDILKNKKKNDYFQLFGKYIANSILNSYLVGINFSPVFIKLLYNDPVEFSDLLAVIPQQQGKRYKYLLDATQEVFQDLDLYFTAIVDKKKELQQPLKADGANIRVNQTNVTQYLDLLTKVLLKNRYQQIIKSFVLGFDSVIQIDMVRRWIRPEQFWCLTAGTKQITPQILLNYINFSGSGNIQILNGWFRRFIQQSNRQVLEGFLKFASGSSSIQFDQRSKVVVTWQQAGQNPKKLPISHTCWKQIVIPKYKTYEIMQKLLNAAFIFCSEGFGFG